LLGDSETNSPIPQIDLMINSVQNRGMTAESVDISTLTSAQRVALM
jgi:hypothetical protein